MFHIGERALLAEEYQFQNIRLPQHTEGFIRGIVAFGANGDRTYRFAPTVKGAPVPELTLPAHALLEYPLQPIMRRLAGTFLEVPAGLWPLVLQLHRRLLALSEGYRFQVIQTRSSATPGLSILLDRAGHPQKLWQELQDEAYIVCELSRRTCWECGEGAQPRTQLLRPQVLCDLHYQPLLEHDLQKASQTFFSAFGQNKGIVSVVPDVEHVQLVVSVRTQHMMTLPPRTWQNFPVSYQDVGTARPITREEEAQYASL